MPKFCILDDARQCDNCGECYICIYDKTKICNNCEKCLWGKLEGKPDITSIKIDEIITLNEELEEDGVHVVDFDYKDINEDDLGETFDDNFWEKEEKYWRKLEKKYRLQTCTNLKFLRVYKNS